MEEGPEVKFFVASVLVANKSKKTKDDELGGNDIIIIDDIREHI